ncbi:hypothetical protein JAAARDRAFT_522375 [Jaapia argillacea MUCL 33604]|uniref:Uncharacterized protein n=1 Tax=Jaapia argillacea MUCL 33604 TaxID=933084 RepID=A0A067Q402_9AGAM|nr:hypothetical protein JAAARDRAFT_522375 [Jaapia argillacea MUCL 33604]
MGDGCDESERAKASLPRCQPSMDLCHPSAPSQRVTIGLLPIPSPVDAMDPQRSLVPTMPPSPGNNPCNVDLPRCVITRRPRIPSLCDVSDSPSAPVNKHLKCDTVPQPRFLYIPFLQPSPSHPYTRRNQLHSPARGQLVPPVHPTMSICVSLCSQGQAQRLIMRSPFVVFYVPIIPRYPISAKPPLDHPNTNKPPLAWLSTQSDSRFAYQPM